MRLKSFTAYETDINVTVGGHIRIQQYDVDGAERIDSTYVLLTPDQAEELIKNLGALASNARIQKIKFDAEGVEDE